MNNPPTISSDFKLHPNLEAKTFIIDLPLCRVLLEDEANYPWVMLVPRRPFAYRIMDLSQEDQKQLLLELDLAQNILWDHFKPTQINVAALGNKTPQLHVHVIARFENDPAWPKTVWDHQVRAPYSSEQKKGVVELLNRRLRDTAFHGGVF